MDKRALKQLSLDHGGSLLSSLVNRKVGMAVVSSTALVTWSEGCAPDSVIHEAIALLTSGDAPETVTSEPLREVRLGPDAALLACPLDAAQSAWLVCWFDDEAQAAPADRERVRDTLPRIASFMAREAELETEISGAVRELGMRYEELNLVYQVEANSGAGHSYQEALQTMIRGFTDHMPVDVAMFVNRRDGNVDWIHAVGDRPIENIDLVLTEMRGRIARFVRVAERSVVINDPADPLRQYLLPYLPYRLLAIVSGSCQDIESMIVLLRHNESPEFSNADVNLARAFLGQSTIMLRNRYLLDRMEGFSRQIASSLVEAVEAKDPYTRGHSERVEEISDGLGRGVHLNESDLTGLYWGSLLHDIGKIGIPDAILSKPGRLTPDEYTFIKTHPERSYEILRHIKNLNQAALDGARYHQERFDGGGYPFGLKGEEIPLVARVVAIADTYDAITSSRSYRAAMPHGEAMNLIRECAGSQLDPTLVEVFCRLESEDAVWLDSIRPPNGPNDG